MTFVAERFHRDTMAVLTLTQKKVWVIEPTAGRGFWKCLIETTNTEDAMAFVSDLDRVPFEQVKTPEPVLLTELGREQFGIAQRLSGSNTYQIKGTVRSRFTAEEVKAQVLGAALTRKP